MLSRFFPFRLPPPLDRHQHCLQFVFFNTVTWQIGLGTPLLLFAEQIGASSGQVGLLASLILLLTPVQILSTALLPRIGYKRLMLSGWGIRSFLLLVPVAVACFAWWRGPQPWMAGALLGAIAVFCLFRAIALAANSPWFYAIIPREVRGAYFSSESSLVGTASILILLLSAGLFAVLPVYPALALQYALAVAGSVWSWFALRKIPEGPKPPPTSLAGIFAALPKLVGAKSDFRRYLMLSLIFWIVTSPVGTFIAYHLKAEERVSSGWIMALEILRYGGMVVAAQLISRRIDRVGARPYMLTALGLYMVLAAYWIVRLNGHLGGAAGLVFSYAVFGLASTAWGVGNANYLPKVARADDHTLMLAVHGSATALAGGLATITWGTLLNPGGGATGLDVRWFQGLFACLLAGAAVVSYRLARRPEPDADPAEPLMVVNTVLRPWRAAAYLMNLAEPLPRRPADKRGD